MGSYSEVVAAESLQQVLKAVKVTSLSTLCPLYHIILIIIIVPT